jgi:hypothetical protein
LPPHPFPLPSKGRGLKTKGERGIAVQDKLEKPLN